MTTRPTVPGLRRPADVLFRGPAEPAPTTEPHVKISVYLPAGLLGALDSYRAGLLTEHGVRVDRSRILRELVRELPELPQIINRLRAEERTP